jgi:two-component system, LytTR family, response regulator
MQNQVKITHKKLVNIASIVACKAEANYTQIYFVDGTKYLSASTLSVFDSKLKPYPFFRANRGVLINLAAIERADYETIYLKNNMEITLARRRKTEFKTIFFNKAPY